MSRKKINHSTTPEQKPHIVLVCDKWFNGSPARGESNYTWGFMSTLKRSEFCTGDIFHFDDYAITHGIPGDRALFDLCAVKKPTVLFIAWTPSMWIEKVGDMSTPSLETLYRIRHELGIPIVIHLSDYYMECRRQVAEQVHPLADYITVSDCTLFKSLASRPEKFIFMLEPADPDIFKLNPSVERDIDVSFIGSTWVPDSYKGGTPRVDYILHLRKHMPLTVMGGRSFKYANGCSHQSTGLDIPIEEFAKFLLRSKITLNIGVHQDGNWQAKGRFHQGKLCGAMMMEAHHRDVDIFYEPYKEYVPFFNETDLVEKARYYLEHEDERLKIAEAGRLRALRDHTGELFWKTLVKAVTIGGAVDPVESLKSVGLDLIRQKQINTAVSYFSEYAEVNPTDEAHRLHARSLALAGEERKALRALALIERTESSESWKDHCKEALLSWHQNRNHYAIKLLESLLPHEYVTPAPSILRRTILFPPTTSGKDWELAGPGIYVLSLAMRLWDKYQQGSIDMEAVSLLSEIDKTHGIGAKTVHLLNLSGILFEREETVRRISQTLTDLCLNAFQAHGLISPEELCLYSAHYGEQMRYRKSFKIAQEALATSPDCENVQVFCASFARLVDYTNAKTGEIAFDPSHLALPPLVGVNNSINEAIANLRSGLALYLPQINLYDSLTDAEHHTWSQIHRSALSQPGHFAKFLEFPWPGFVFPINQQTKESLFRTVLPPDSIDSEELHLKAALLTYIANSQEFFNEAITRATQGACGLLESFLFAAGFFIDSTRLCFLRVHPDSNRPERITYRPIKVVGNQFSIADTTFVISSSLITEMIARDGNKITLARPLQIAPRWIKATSAFRQHGTRLVDQILREIIKSEAPQTKPLHSATKSRLLIDSKSFSK